MCIRWVPVFLFKKVFKNYFPKDHLAALIIKKMVDKLTNFGIFSRMNEIVYIFLAIKYFINFRYNIIVAF